MTLPAPVPDVGATVAHAAGLLAFHVQPEAPLTAMEPDPPAATTKTLLVLAVGLHVVAAACETATFVPATVSVVDRVLVDVFAAMSYVTFPAPVPEAGLTVTQATGLLACQVHPATALTAIAPLEPVAAADTLVVSAEGALVHVAVGAAWLMFNS